jgi:hypothetical protein
MIKTEEIIRNYKPHIGFFDLSEKPSTLGKTEYAKLLNLQNILAESNTKENIRYLKEFNKNQFAMLQELSVNIQQVIFLHWDNETLFN